MLFAFAADHGPLRYLFAVAVAACAFGTFWIVATAALRRGASPLAVAVAVIVTVFGCGPSLGMRVQVVGWFFFAAFSAAALDRDKRWWCVPIAVVWANFHGSVLLAPVTMGVILAADAVADRRLDAGLGRTALVFLGTLVAPLLTPLTWHLPYYTISLANSPIRAYIIDVGVAVHLPVRRR